jgi:ABC-type multidrug transport system permease subunit
MGKRPPAKRLFSPRREKDFRAKGVSFSLVSLPKITSVQKEQIFMNIINAKNWTGIIAGVTGLLFALVYVGLEILTENPEATNSISIWHTPLIWLLASIFFYCVFYAVGTVRGGKVKERAITLSLSVALAILLALFWAYPMISSLMQCFGGSGC